jgi:hypothetical protein
MRVMEPADCLKVLTLSLWQLPPNNWNCPIAARVCDLFHCVTEGRRDVRWPKADDKLHVFAEEHAAGFFNDNSGVWSAQLKTIEDDALENTQEWCLRVKVTHWRIGWPVADGQRCGLVVRACHPKAYYRPSLTASTNKWHANIWRIS